MYLLDSSVLISANNKYYPVDRVPEFWEWLIHQGKQSVCKIPHEVIAEITAGTKTGDLLVGWMKEPANRSALLLEEMVDPKHVNTVLLEGYGENLTDVEMEVIGQDPFLIAYAMADHKNRCVVTVETSAPSRSRARRKLPDVCSGFSLQCCDPFQFYHGVGFRTSWK